jgi:two-component system invasion response regulator UvrY
MTTVPIRIILADDHQIVRDSWKMLLENNPGLMVLSACNNNQEAIDEAARLNPDIVLVDINMASPMNGLSIAAAIIKDLPQIKVMGLSVSNHPKYATRMLELGAMGYVTKTSTLEEINHGIHQVYLGNKYVSKEVIARMTSKERDQF